MSTTNNKLNELRKQLVEITVNAINENDNVSDTIDSIRFVHNTFAHDVVVDILDRLADNDKRNTDHYTYEIVTDGDQHVVYTFNVYNIADRDKYLVDSILYPKQVLYNVVCYNNSQTADGKYRIRIEALNLVDWGDKGSQDTNSYYYEVSNETRRGTITHLINMLETVGGNINLIAFVKDHVDELMEMMLDPAM